MMDFPEQPFPVVDSLITPQFINIDIDTKQRLSCLNIKTQEGQGTALTLIPEHGIIVDAGCGDGRFGAAVAQQRKCALVQADVSDLRRDGYRFGNLMQLNRNSPLNEPSQLSNQADAVLVVDVLEKIIYPGIAPAQSKIAFLKGLVPLLKQEGKIFVASTKVSNSEALRALQIEAMIKEDEELKDKVCFYG